MSSFPCLVRFVSGSGQVRYRLGDRLVDRYLEFVAGRSRPNTLRAVAFDLKTFFTVVGRDPVEVTAVDVFEFLAHQRGDRSVVRLADRESGLSARTIARRLSSVSGLYAYLVARGGTPVRASPVPRGLSTRRQGGSKRSRTVPLVRVPRTLPKILAPDEVDRLLGALRTGNFFILLSGASGLDYCSQLYNDLRTGKPVPQNIEFIRGAASPQSGAALDSVIRPASTAAAPSVFEPVPASQLSSIEELPFLRQRFGYAVAEVGAAAALSQKYPAGWSAATQKSVVCRPQQGGYRCAWSYQLNGAHHSGYVLIAVTANNYRLGKVAEVAQAAPANPASSLSPLWYIAIAVVVVIVAIVVAVLRRRRRATATAQ